MRKAELAIGEDTRSSSGGGGATTTAAATAVEATDARRRAWFYGTIALLALIGLADAIYLTINHLTGSSVRCGEYAGCSEVLSSSYAVIGGLPLAALGGGAYFVVFGLSVLAAFGYRAMQTPLLIVVSTMTVVTGWLLYVQAFVLKAFCFYCLLSATVTLLLAALMITRRRIL